MLLSKLTALVLKKKKETVFVKKKEILKEVSFLTKTKKFL